MILAVSIIIFLCVATHFLAEAKRDLMMMQQNSYRNERYMRWLKSSKDTTSYARLIGLCVGLIALVKFSFPIMGLMLIGVFSVVSASLLIRKKYKKPLVWTKRAKRIYAATVSLATIITIGTAIITTNCDATLNNVIFSCSVCGVFLYCASHILIMTSIWLLNPIEKAINRKFYNEAAEILRSNANLKVIGVTGSYGKTSTKHYLERILSEKYDVLMTPGSFNTTLGVIRTVREMMKPYCEVFICEMGAKQLNDVKEICDLVNPSIGVVTAVGPQHLESFKTIENVQRTKFELVDALPNDGLAVVNNDFPHIANREVNNVKCVRYAVSNPDKADFTAHDITYSPSGTQFTVSGNGNKYTFTTRLVGECNVSNLMAAVIVALHLDVPIDKIQYAIAKIEQVEHRLNMKRTAGGITIIDDAYNSNPSGSAMALDVLSSMSEGKRFVITPGMIELGEKQFELNKELGKKVAESVDVAIVVGEYNREAIVEGVKSVNNPNIQLITVATFAEAQQTMIGMAKAGDTVLYENDLPDTFK